MQSPSPIPYYVVDAFTRQPFSGNPAAVCILQDNVPDHQLQKIAAEFNLSETAFLWSKDINRWKLRWFTPACEVNLCGHATLASAHVLATQFGLWDTTQTFETLSGELEAKIHSKKISLKFPRVEPQMFNRIYLQSQDAGLKQLNLDIVAGYQAGEDIIVELATENDVRNYVIEPDKIAAIDTRGLIITAPSNTADRDFVSRFFAPRAGILEDPVTGSAHCSLGILWSKKLGKPLLLAEQLSQRKGFLEVGLFPDHITLSGECISFAKGEIFNICNE